MSQQAFNIQEAMIHRFTPNYTNEVETFMFSNEEEFDNWFKNEACSHAHWNSRRSYHSKKVMIEGASEYNSTHYSKTICWKCDHFGQPGPREVTIVESSKKRQRTSRKVGCSALFDVYYMSNGSIKVVYDWVHKNHDPSCVEDLAESRLPVEVRD